MAALVLVLICCVSLCTADESFGYLRIVKSADRRVVRMSKSIGVSQLAIGKQGFRSCVDLIEIPSRKRSIDERWPVHLLIRENDALGVKAGDMGVGWWSRWSTGHSDLSIQVRTNVNRWCFACIEERKVSSRLLPYCKVGQVDLVDTYPRPISVSNRSLGRRVRVSCDAISVMSLMPLKRSDNGERPSSQHSNDREVPIDLAVAALFLAVSAKLLTYGVWNIYDGPQDWRGPASLIVGWFPFSAGVWILLLGVLRL